MKKKLRTQKGFTLAELLIVVAIIGVLVAISIPIFGPRLEGSREATDAGNLRSAYAAATSAVLVGKVDDTNFDNVKEGDSVILIYTKDGTLARSSSSPMKGKSTQGGWQGTNLGADLPSAISFDGNSHKYGIYVRIFPNENVVQVAFSEKGEATDFPAFNPTTGDDDEGTAPTTPTEPETPAEPTGD